MNPTTDTTDTTTGKLVGRNIRVDDNLWRAACAKARSDGESIAAVVRALVRGYVRGDFEV